MKNKIIITGATGFIGSELCSELTQKGYEVIALTRNIEKSRKILGNNITHIKWDGRTSAGWDMEANKARAIINLAGDNVSTGPWTEAKKRKILQSRLDTGKAVLEAIKKAPEKPEVLIQASAVGFYGITTGSTEVDEYFPSGIGFLARVTRDLEKIAEGADQWGVRRAVIRTGLVLGQNGGALPKLQLPFKFFVGGHFGNGRHYMPWIHLEDEIRAIIFLLENNDVKGIFNLAAPQPVTAREFAKTLGSVMKRPSWFHLPAFAVKLVFGDMGKEALLSGPRVMPRRLINAGFRFNFEKLEDALKNLVY